MRQMIHIVMVFIISLSLTGCDSAHYGGAPEPSFDVEKDLKQLAEGFGNSISISDYYEQKKSGGSEEQLKATRDKFTIGRLTLMNIRYIQFIRQSTSDRQLLDSAVDILGIGLNIAGVSFDSAATKTALAAAAAGVTGSKATIDKNYYFEKTIPALITAMNAQRKAALVPILEGLQKDINEYPFEQAVTDLHNYYSAGTFIGAIQAIQTDAGAKERDQDMAIKVIKRGKATPKQRNHLMACTQAIGKLTEADLTKAQTVLTSLDPQGTLPTNIKDAKSKLQDYVFYAEGEDIEKVYNAFKNAKIIP